MTTRDAEAQLVRWMEEYPKTKDPATRASFQALYPFWRDAFQAGRPTL
jgi:hypothetical protein